MAGKNQPANLLFLHFPLRHTYRIDFEFGHRAQSSLEWIRLQELDLASCGDWSDNQCEHRWSVDSRLDPVTELLTPCICASHGTSDIK